MTKFWPLMSQNAITPEDRRAMADFLLSGERLTQGPRVKAFEQAWSKWQGCQYSVYVNSGSSANLILLNALQILYGVEDVVCQAVTWSTNVAPGIQLGMRVRLCDTHDSNLGPDPASLRRVLSTLPRRTVVFLTHLLGFSAMTPEIAKILDDRDAIVIEDCCEATGTVDTVHDTKVGNAYSGGTFSFYYGHHLNSVEGGMVCTNNEQIYEILLLLRSHGLRRELPNPDKYPVTGGTDPKFTFLVPGYNVRNTEVNALLGMRQLSRADAIIQARNANYNTFIKMLDSERYQTDFNREGMSSFCFPINCLNGELRKAAEIKLNAFGIETRPLISGNLARQQFLAQLGVRPHQFPGAECLHENAFYVGNNPDVTTEDAENLATLLNGIEL